MTTNLELGATSYAGPTPEQWAAAAEYGKQIANQIQPDMILNQQAVTGPSKSQRFTTALNELLCLFEFHGTAEAKATLQAARDAIRNDSAVADALQKVTTLTNRLVDTRDKLGRVGQSQATANADHTDALGGDSDEAIEVARRKVVALDTEAASLTRQRDVLTDLLSKAQADHRTAQSDAAARAQASLLQDARAKRQVSIDKLGEHMRSGVFMEIAEAIAASSTLVDIAAGSVYTFENNMDSYLQDGIYYRQS